MLILPFDHPPKAVDHSLADKLKAEWPGILSWLIAGCLDWQSNGLVLPTVVKRATAEYFDAEDSFAQWIADCCEMGPDCADTSDNLWRSWSCYARGLGEDAGTRKGTFAETLSQRGFLRGEKIGPNRKRGYRYIRVTTGVSDFEESDDGIV